MTPGYKKKLAQIALKFGDAYKIDPKSCARGIEICLAFQRHGILTTLGKFSLAGIDAPEIILQEYLQSTAALKDIAVENNFYLSIKPPALQFNFEYAKSIAVSALKNGHGIHFDSHEHDLAEPSLRLIEKLMAQTKPEHDDQRRWRWSVSLPSRWKRSLADMVWAFKNNIRVRIVKGEFKASRLSDEMNPKQGFLTLVDNLAGNVDELAVATHDRKLAREAITRAEKKGTKVELELLFGMPVAKMVALSKEMDVPVRFYVAFGDALLLYGLKHYLTEPQKLLQPELQEIFGRCDSKLTTVISSL